MAREQLPFQPIRTDLYTSGEISQGFVLGDPESMLEMADFKTFQYFVKHGRATPEDPHAGMMEALHDNSILQAMGAFLKGRKRVAAIMGGHREDRCSSAYRSVVELSKTLSENGFLLASGGGPGAMEATHLGALMAGREQKDVDDAIALLAKEPKLPHDAGDVIRKDGTVNRDGDIVERLHKWSAPAHQLMRELRRTGGTLGESLAVPTWHYGHEPVTPLASHIAKYFLNSIREDVLLYLATQGIIYAPGRAGTLQEVFQDAAQNYYASSSGGVFSPMVFFDADRFWSERLPVKVVLDSLFNLAGGALKAEYEAKVRTYANIKDIVDFLNSNAPSAAAQTLRAEALGIQVVLRQT
ncbi:hypothetical protein [Bradyrhizobium sp. BRP23]|uniref:LOG family protein n=1 Tax=Bradyrhizobium sp. BRP23 TaxID=2793820 RepID=UPI001CD46154|nr:hypothetical protein [Bradyrhizobium sp. BRP23]MCA1381451.1 hypothetical protein [Bradyrhizobium sp. BRP05]MCA1422293.1 hypothetical protein [Bradyrhizobium sp. BRP23]